MEKSARAGASGSHSPNIARLLEEAIDSASNVPVAADANGAPPAAPTAPPDPRIALAAKALESGDWRKVAAELPIDTAGALPPALGVLSALAHHESGGDEVAQRANEVAIQSVAALFGVAANGPIALVVAKRLLRKNPSAWRTRPAPPAKASLAIVAATLTVGSGLGWLLSTPWATAFVRAALHR